MVSLDTVPEALTKRTESDDPDTRVFTFLLVKLAQRCNINCTYCYWFRDADVYKKPSLLTVDAEDAFCERLEQHVQLQYVTR